MSNEKKDEPKKDQLTVTIDQLQGIVKTLLPYYPMVKWGARLMGVKIPPEIDEMLTAIQKGEMPDLDKLKALGETVSPGIGEPVLTRPLAEEAWYLHNVEKMGTREIADYFTNERKCPCSHATVARWINLVDQDKRASRVGTIVSIVKYAGIAAVCVLSAWLAHIFW